MSNTPFKIVKMFKVWAFFLKKWPFRLSMECTLRPKSLSLTLDTEFMVKI